MKTLWFFTDVLPMIMMLPFLIILLLADWLLRASHEKLQQICSRRSGDFHGE